VSRYALISFVAVVSVLMLGSWVFAAPGPDPSKSGSGRDGGPGYSTRSEHGSSRAGSPVGPSCDAQCEADLIENDRKANDPNFEPDPLDPDSTLDPNYDPTIPDPADPDAE
jgi:hypothetical protein